MYPYEYQRHQQNYSEEQHHRYPQHQDPHYRESADYDGGFPPSNYPPMPPQFGPPGYPPMGPPEPYAGSVYPSSYPPPHQGAYPPVSSVGPFGPQAYPPMYPPTQEYGPLPGREYPPASASYPPSYPPVREYTYPSFAERQPSLDNSPNSYSPTREDTYPSFTERQSSLHNLTRTSSREDTYPSFTERQSSLHNLTRTSSRTQEDTHPSAPELHPSLHTTPLYSSTQEDAYSIRKPQPGSPAPALLSDGELPKGDLVRVFCKANRSLNLAVQGDSVVMATANVQDDAQLWIKDGKCGVRIKDCSGQPAFILVNKASKKVLKHSNDRERSVQLIDYSADIVDEDVLWTESQDFGEGFKTIRMVCDTLLNITVFNGHVKGSGVCHGSSIVLDTWHKKDHQLWKIFPL